MLLFTQMHSQTASRRLLLKKRDASKEIVPKSNRIREGSRLANFMISLVAGLACLCTLYPMYYVFIMSISDPAEVIAMNVFLYPKGLYFHSYELLFTDHSMWRAYLNTILYTTSSTVLVLLTSVMGAYPLTIKGLKGRKFLVAFLLVPMYFSGGIIPTYLLMSRLGLYDNAWAIILPSAVSIWYIILTRSYFASIPYEMRESAQMDGANNLQILFRIYVPIAKPILAVVAIYAIVGMWNSWFSAQIYLPSQELHPLQMYLKQVLVQQTVDLTKLNKSEMESAVEQMLSATQIKYAMIIFTTLPIIFTYPFFQKYFIKGVMIGSLKG